MDRLSFPREHGAYLTLAGAATGGALLAPQPGPAVGVSVALAMAFLVRGPLERLGRAPVRDWDLPAIAVMSAVAFAGVFLAAKGRAAAAAILAGAALALPATTLAARRLRFFRGLLFEMLALGGLGACAGLAAWCGGLGPRDASALGLALAAHAAVSVPLVRVQVWKRVSRGQLLLGTTLALVMATAVLLWLGRPLAVAVLAPRAIQIAILAGTGPRRHSPRQVGLVETALLTLVVAALAWVV